MRRFFHFLSSWAAFCLVCLLFLSLSLPVQAATTNAQLEKQVLQIIRTHPEVIIESLQAYQAQQQQQLQQARQTFLQDLNTNLPSLIGNSPTTGATQLNTVLIEFSDFQCPYCAEASKTLKQLLAKYPNDLTLVYKHFPLYQIHKEALPSAKAAWAANQQGKFWEYQDALFADQKQLGEALYLDIAKNLNLDIARFKHDRILANAPILEDLHLAEKLGFQGTPTFILKSKNFSGDIQLSEIERILQEEGNREQGTGNRQ